MSINYLQPPSSSPVPIWLSPAEQAYFLSVSGKKGKYEAGMAHNKIVLAFACLKSAKKHNACFVASKLPFFLTMQKKDKLMIED